MSAFHAQAIAQFVIMHIPAIFAKVTIFSFLENVNSVVSGLLSQTCPILKIILANAVKTACNAIYLLVA